MVYLDLWVPCMWCLSPLCCLKQHTLGTYVPTIAQTTMFPTSREAQRRGANEQLNQTNELAHRLPQAQLVSSHLVSNHEAIGLGVSASRRPKRTVRGVVH